MLRSEMLHCRFGICHFGSRRFGSVNMAVISFVEYRILLDYRKRGMKNFFMGLIIKGPSSIAGKNRGKLQISAEPTLSSSIR